MLAAFESSDKVKPKTQEERQAEIHKTLQMPFAERADNTSNPLAKNLLQIMENKETNLCVSADVTTKEQLLSLINQVGPYICLLKTHIDIIEGFDQELIKQLQLLANKYNFLIFEDRKFADIGNTVKLQYTGGVHEIANWAHLVNAHSMPGDGVLKALSDGAGEREDRGCLLIAEMSSAGNLCDEQYSRKTVEMAERHKDFVIGFICQSRLSGAPGLIHMTPGVQIDSKGDGLGQRYNTPELAMETGTDIIIVGRGIYAAESPAAAAEQYRDIAWSEYKKRITAEASAVQAKTRMAI